MSATSPLSASGSGEVVTHALVRRVTLGAGAGNAAVLTLDNGFDHKKPTTFGPQGLIELDAALDDIQRAVDAGEVTALCVTGKPFIFCVGADLKSLRTMSSRDQVVDLARTGHRVFGRLGEISVPSFAFINGAAMGGGLEVALHCDYRTVSSAAGALALPEVFLGLIPGWGGAWLLPNLIGPDAAVTMILDNPLTMNRMTRPAQALAMGVVDAMFEPADFLEESLRWAAQVVRGDVKVSRPDIDRTDAWDAAIARANDIVDVRTHGVPSAPRRAVDLIAGARTRPQTEGFAEEDQALADLAVGDELAASLYAFDLVQKRARHPVGIPELTLARPVTKVGIIGAGLMASQLALLFASRLEVPVLMTDIDDDRVRTGLEAVRDEVGRQLKKGRLSRDTANRLTALVTASTDHRGFADADFVIEAVYEDLGVKQQVFAELEEVVDDTCVLATNTSSLSVSAMAAKLRHPERLVGVHFFNPVAVMQLVEVVRGEQTNDAALATAFAVAGQLKKSAVLVKDAPGFVVNRLLARLLGEVSSAVDEGTPLTVADAALDPMSLPMSPFMLLQLVGPAVALHVSETLHSAFPERFAVSPSLTRFVESGKTSFFTWTDGEQRVDPDVADLFGHGANPSTADQVLQRTLAAVAQEIRLMLDEGVVAAAEDVDLCMILGAGWPFWNGGITPFLDREGVSRATTGTALGPVSPRSA